MTSTVTVHGAKRQLREGQVQHEDDPLYPESYQRAHLYVGGQTARSFDVAWSIIDRAMGEFGCAEAPSRCASLRFGNCLSVRLLRSPELPDRIAREEAGNG